MKKWTILSVIVFFAGLGFGSSSQAGELKEVAADVVREALGSENPYQRVKAIEVVSVAKLKRFMPIVERLMADSYIPVRFGAAVAVGDMKYSHSREALKKLVKVGDSNSSIAAAYGLAKMGETEYVRVIRRALGGEDQGLKANAAMLLGKLGNRSDLPLLYEVLKDKKASDAAMFGAAVAIAKIGDTKIYQKLWTLLISKHPDDRIVGIEAMGALGSSDAHNAILTMLYDDVLEVRLAAAAELGKMGDKSGVRDMYDAMTKPLEEIEAEGFDSGKKDEKEQKKDRPIIYRSSQQRQKAVERVKTLSALAIGYVKNKKLDDFLKSLIADDSFDVRIAAAQSILIRGL